MNKNFNRYREAGVDIDTGDTFVARIKPHLAGAAKVLAAHDSAFLPDAGGFAAVVRLPGASSVLAVCADGVGTKTELLMQRDLPQTAGIDVVAMCVNDLICTGARPFLFLDYYACESLSPDFAARVIDGIVRGCEAAGCALAGGETAEMPGIYAKEAFDLAGFAVGIADDSELLKPDEIAPGDAIIGIFSSGPHSNGYSLIRDILRESPPPPADILAPTRIYCRAIAALRKCARVRGLAHITGGGIRDNLPRILPPHVSARVSLPPLPPVFQWIRDAGGVSEDEMRRVFNCGIGMTAIVAAEDAAAAQICLRENGETCARIGEIIDGDRRVVFSE